MAREKHAIQSPDDAHDEVFSNFEESGYGEEEVESEEDLDLEEYDDIPFNAMTDSYTSSAWPVSRKNTT